MTDLNKIQQYYKGEQTEALIMVIVGLIVGIILLFLWKYTGKSDFGKGLIIPFIVLFIFLFCSGIFNYYNNGKRLENKTIQYQENHVQFFETEINKMENISTWWMPLKIVWTLLIIVGLIIVFSTNRSYIHGIAVGIIIFGAVGHIIDGFAYERNESYKNIIVNN